MARIEVAADRRLVGQAVLDLVDTPIEDFAHRNRLAAAFARGRRSKTTRRESRSSAARCLPGSCARSDSRLANHAATLAETSQHDEADDGRGAQSCRSAVARWFEASTSAFSGSERRTPSAINARASASGLPRCSRKSRLRPSLSQARTAADRRACARRCSRFCSPQLRTRGQCSSSASCATETTG